MPPKVKGSNPPPVGPTYLRAPERGVLCYEVLINNYLGQWLTAKTITAHFYTEAYNELNILKNTEHGKKVAAEKPKSDQKEIDEVRNLPSTPPHAQRKNTSTPDKEKGKGNSNGQRPLPPVPPQNQHQAVKPNASGTTTNDAEKLQSRIKGLDETNKKLDDERMKLYEQVSSLHLENQQLTERINNLRSQLREAHENMNDLRLRLSKMAGDNMRSNNPNLADLSDPYRPTELGKMFGEIYDNEWSDGFEVVRGETEKDKIDVLYSTLMDIYKFCGDNFTRQTAAIDECLINPALISQDQYPDTDIEPKEKKTVEFKTALKDRRKQLAPITAKQLAGVYSKYELPKKQGLGETERLSPKLINYARKCCELCWFMVISDPPLVFSEERGGHEFATDIFRPYTRSQKDMEKPLIEMVVWPALYLHFEGPLLAKGVAQPFSGKDTHTK